MSTVLEGTFDEAIRGLMPTPNHVAGHRSCRSEAFPKNRLSSCFPKISEMPSGIDTQPPSIADAFPGWSTTLCSVQAKAQVGCTSTLNCADRIDKLYHGPLEASLSGCVPAESAPLQNTDDPIQLEIVREP